MLFSKFASWKATLKLDQDADLIDYKLVLISRLVIVALVFIITFGTLNIVMDYPLVNTLIDVTGVLLMIGVFIAAQSRMVVLASLGMTLGLMAAITFGSLITYAELRDNGAENLIIAMIVLIVALFDGKLRVYLFILAFGLLIWLKYQKYTSLNLATENDFFVELVNIAVICCGIYFSTAFFKSGLQKNLDRVNKLNSGLKEQGSQLAELNKEKDELIGIVAHDLKNPLHVLTGALPVLKKELAASLTHDQEKLFQIMEDSSRGMVGHIGQILNVNKLETAGINLDPKEHDLCELLQKLVDLHRHSGDLKNIEIKGDLTKGRHIVTVDENCVSRVFENLLSNAIKYTLPEKSIYLSMDDLGSKVQVKFRDEGPGINEGDRRKLFQKYESLYAKPTGDESSTGMGLFSVKKYLSAINGSIDVESEEGFGTTFTVLLPKN